MIKKLFVPLIGFLECKDKQYFFDMKTKISLHKVTNSLIILLLLIFGSSFINISNAQIIITYAGNDVAGYSGDGGQATAAELSNMGLATDALGNLYLADYGSNRVRKINATSGIITTLAGTGTNGYSGDGGQATAAKIGDPYDVVLDANGNLFIADYANQRIRKVNTSGVISTFAGNGVAGYTGDGGQATAAELDHPNGLAIDVSGNIYILDLTSGVVREVNTSGVISTIIGNGVAGFSGDGGQATAAEIDNPRGIGTDASGNLYISDAGNERIRKVTASSGIISTIAGNGVAGASGNGGPATAAEVNLDWDIKVNKTTGDIYFIDYDNPSARKINTSGIISDVAGDIHSGYTGDGGQATVAELFQPLGLGIDPTGNIYIGDQTNKVIRKVYLVLTVSTNITANVTCNGGSNGSVSATPTNGTTPYTYLWSNSATTTSISSLTAGTYTITVTDKDGVTGTATAIITQPSALSSSASSTSNVICNGASTGSVSSTPSNGTSPYTYSWSGGGTNSTKTGLAAGTYTITVTDNCGVTATASTTVAQPTTLSVAANTTVNVSCNGGSNGNVFAIPSNGTSPYTYSWTGGGTNSTKTVSAGIYTITITDNCGATATAATTVTQPTALSVAANTTANIYCYGGSNGSVSATPSGGTSPYTYLWSGGGTNSTKTGLSVGIYTITTTDNNGCTATSSTTITQPIILKDSLASISFPFGYSGTGTATIGVSGGTPPYTYTWNPNVSSTGTAIGLIARVYTVTVHDKNNCSASMSFGPDTIKSGAETVYSGGVATTSLAACTQDSIVFKITVNPNNSDTVYIKLPDGISFVSWLHDSNFSKTYLRSQDSIAFFGSINSGYTFRISILVNTPPCGAQHTTNQYTTISEGLNWFSCSSVNLTISSPELKVDDISRPLSMSLGVGSVDEFVYRLTNFSVGTEIPNS